MADLKALRPEIEKKLQELMKARGWVLQDDPYYCDSYKRDAQTIKMGVESRGEGRYIDSYWILIAGGVRRSFKVETAHDSFTIDEKKLDKKIEEVCAILRERDEVYRKSEKRTEERQKGAVKFAAEIDNLLPGYRVEPVSPKTANLFTDSETFISITKVQLCMYHLVVTYPLIASERTLAKLVETLTDHS